MSIKECCIKCNAVLKKKDYGYGWRFTDDGKPYHMYKCLYPGQERVIVY